jgi:hypothetical protein
MNHAVECPRSLYTENNRDKYIQVELSRRTKKKRGWAQETIRAATMFSTICFFENVISFQQRINRSTFTFATTLLIQYYFQHNGYDRYPDRWIFGHIEEKISFYKKNRIVHRLQRIFCRYYEPIVASEQSTYSRSTDGCSFSLCRMCENSIYDTHI